MPHCLRLPSIHIKVGAIAPLISVPQPCPKLMGLWLPTGKIAAKTHTAIALIIIITVLSMRNRLFTVLHLYPFLYVILVIRSCLIFRFIGRTAVTTTAFILFLTALFYRIQNSDWIQNLGVQVPVLLKERIQDRLKLLNLGFALTVALLMGLALLFIFLLVNALLSERYSREQMAIANQQLCPYALRVETKLIAHGAEGVAMK